MINAAFILGAIESKDPRAVMVPELSINDPYWHDWDHRPSPDKRLDGHEPIRRIDALMFDSYSTHRYRGESLRGGLLFGYSSEASSMAAGDPPVHLCCPASSQGHGTAWLWTVEDSRRRQY